LPLLSFALASNTKVKIKFRVSRNKKQNKVISFTIICFSYRNNECFNKNLKLLRIFTFYVFNYHIRKVNFV